MIELDPEVLGWARERAGLTDQALADKMGVTRDRIAEWERSGRLRQGQIERLARVTHTPIGYLYLPTPPEEHLPLPDFRVVTNEQPTRPSPDLIDVLDDAERRQRWYREYLLTVGAEPLDFVGSLSEGSPVVQAAAAISDRHELDPTARRDASTWEEALRRDIERIEESGVLILRNGVVGNNTHRPLDVEEFRGFAMADQYAPLVFVNARDAKAAQFFTLMHELVHIWLGRSGVSNLDRTLPRPHEVERYSNAIAAEILVPAAALAEYWQLYDRQLTAVNSLTRQFKVSGLVVLRRLYDLNYIDWETFRSQYEAEEARFLSSSSREDQGGDFYRTQTARVSRRFARALIGEVLEGRTGWRDAYSFLGIRNASTFYQLAHRLGFPA